MGRDGGGEGEGIERLNPNLCVHLDLPAGKRRRRCVWGGGVSKVADSLITMATDAEQAAMAFYILGEI